MNLEVCEYARVKEKLEKFSEILRSTKQQMESLDVSRQQTVRQLKEEKNKSETETNEQYHEEKQRRYGTYNKQLSQVQNVQASMEQLHQQLLSENRNYSIVYKEMSKNPQILKSFVDCTDAINTINNLWANYNDVYYDSVQNRIVNLMTKKRRQEYEYLVVWKNTVDYYVEVLPGKMQEELNQWENLRGQENATQKNNAQNEYDGRIQTLEQNFHQKKMEIWNESAKQINQLFSEEEVRIYHAIFDRYIENAAVVNQKELIRDEIVDMSLVGVRMDVLEEEDHPLLGFLQKKFQDFLDGDTLYVPILSTARKPICYYATAACREDIQKFMKQYLVSQIMRVKASKITLHVIDCVYQGNSVSFLTPLGKQVSDLFGDGILTREQEVTERLQQLNEKTNMLHQEVFTSTADSIFDLDTDEGIDVVALYDFPNGLTKESMSYLWNLIKEGPACGIYVVMADGNVDLSHYMDDMRIQIENVKQLCQEIQLDGENSKMDNFSYINVIVCDEENFQEQCTQYAVATKVMERKQKLLTNKLIKWADSGDGDYANDQLEALQKEVLEHLKVRSRVPEGKMEFPKKILLGEVLYPFGLFENQGGIFGAMCFWLGDEDHICEPWYFDLKENQNLLVTMKEQDVLTGQRFLHNVIWGFLSELPVLKYNICVIDCERKGGSIRPFLELREQVPELFDDTIYTNTEDVHQRLQRYNEMIEDRIQSKLGNQYKNILEYNKENENNSEILHTIAIYDFPCGFDTKNMQLLLNILKNGSKCGVYTVIGYNEDVPVDSFDRSADLIEQIKELTTQVKAADKKYLFTESGCQISIDLEKYLECSKSGSLYYEKSQNLDYEYVDEDDGDEEDESEYIFSEDEAVEYIMDEEEYEGYSVGDEFCVEHTLKMEQKVLLNTDENGFLVGISDKYCIDCENWFLDREEMKNFVSAYVNIVRKKKQEGLTFENVLDETLFEKNAADILEIPIGIGDQGKKISITFGEKGTSSHHGLITGATGSGKSSLLHTLIMSAMLHYSPEQLHLYLLDFKNGTEFKIYEDYHLPHIQLLALDSMQEFGESILEKLVQVMEERSTACKNVNAKNIADYVKSTGEAMPRILVIMDEFQLLYNSSSNSSIARNCAELTKRLVMEGRAFGIHLLMSTQSARIISSLSLDKDVVGQMRIRVGLKCGEEDTRYLFGERNERQAFEWMRGPIGTAVLNEDFVEGNNVGFRVVYCKESTQKELLQKIAQQFADYKSEKIIFEGSRTTDLLDAIEKEKEKETKGAQIAVGDLLKVSEDPLYISYDRRKSHNTIIVGTDAQMAENISNGLCFSILQKPNTKVYCVDGEVLVGEEEAVEMYDQFSNMSASFSLAEVYGDVIRFINQVYDTLCRKKKVKDNTNVFVFFKNLQYLDLVKQMLKGELIDESEYIDLEEEDVSESESATEKIEDFFDFGLEVGDFSKKLNAASAVTKKQGKDLNVSQKLLKLIAEGSSVGIHFIVSCLEFQTLKETLYEVNMSVNKLVQKFPERLLFSLNDMDASLLIDSSISVSGLPDNTVYYTDSINNVCMVKPFRFPKLEQLKEYVGEN